MFNRKIVKSTNFLISLSKFPSKSLFFNTEHLAKNGRMSEPDARKTFAQILSAVEYCHKRHVVHRDLKVYYYYARKGSLTNWVIQKNINASAT